MQCLNSENKARWKKDKKKIYKVRCIPKRGIFKNRWKDQSKLNRKVKANAIQTRKGKGKRKGKRKRKGKKKKGK